MLEHAAEWAVRQQTAPLSDKVVHHTKRAIIDWVAALYVGGVMPPARILAEAVARPGSGASALVPSGDLVDVRTAALVNGTAAHVAEVDDIFRDGAYHPGAPTIAAALAAAQHLDASGEQLLRAVFVGYEISTRIAANVQPAHYRFWHTTGTIGTLGAAAAVATLLEADAERFAHAVNTATTMAAGLQQAFRSDAMSKPLHSGHAADAGTLAALAAARGYTGVADILSGEAGFGAAMSDNPSWDHVFDDLDDVVNIAAMTFKNHTCCGHTFAAIDGAIELREAHAIEADDVAKVEVATYSTAIKVAGNPAPQTGFEAQFSIQYCIAAALRIGSVRLAAFAEDQLVDPQIRDLLARVELSVDDDLDAAFPKQRGANVTITLRDGTPYTTHRPTRKGDPDMPLTDDELTEKFAELVSSELDDDDVAQLSAALWSLEGRDEVRSLLTAMSAA